MSVLSIGQIQSSADGHRISAPIQMGKDQFEVFFQANETQLTPNPEAFLAIALLPAMKLKLERIEYDGIVSRQFVEGMKAIQQVFRTWKPTYGELDYDGLKTRPDRDCAVGKSGVFFSGGVDSYYTFLSRRDQVDALINIDGFDIPLEQQSMRRRMKENLRLIGERFNKQIIFIETNARQFSERFLAWSFAHGSVIAGSGHLLSPEFSTFYLASFGNPHNMYRFGVHPEIDPHWSSDCAQFHHADSGVNKIEEIQYSGQFNTFCETLRICLRYPEKGLNCGRCEKCLRTMVYLQAAGVYPRMKVFEKPLDLSQLSRYKRLSGPDKDLLYVALNMLEQQNTYPETVNVLRKILYRGSWEKKLIKLGRDFRNEFNKKIKPLKRL